MFRKLWRILAPFHKQFYALVVLAFFYEAGGVLVSYTVPLIVQLFAINVPLPVWLFVVLGVLAFNEGYMRLDNQYDWRVIARIYHPIYKFLRLKAMGKFLKMPLIWHQQHDSGTLIGQISDGIWKTCDVVTQITWELVTLMIQTVLSLGPMLYFSPPAAALSVLTVLAFAFITVRGERMKESVRKARQDVVETSWQHAVSVVQAIETVIEFNLKKFWMRIIGEDEDKFLELSKDEHHLGFFVYGRMKIRLLTFMRLGIYVIWVIQLYQGGIGIPALIFLSVLLERLFSSFWRLHRLADRIYTNSEAIGRLIGLLEEPEPIETGKERVSLTGPVEISVEDVCLAYSEEYAEANGALHGISLCFKAGEVTALVGPSGSGKSTVVAALMKLYRIHSGRVTVGGLDIQNWDGEALLSEIAHVFPGDKVYLFNESLGFNIGVGNPNATQEQIIAAAKQAGIHDFIMSLKNGYDSQIGERGVKLSSGQRQRIGIARALLRDSKIIILDEPTSAVDAQTEHLIMTGLKEMFVGRTVIVIAHRLSTIRDADTIYVLEKGRVIEEGNHRSLVARGGLYAKMVAMQIESERLD